MTSLNLETSWKSEIDKAITNSFLHHHSDEETNSDLNDREDKNASAFFGNPIECEKYTDELFGENKSDEFSNGFGFDEVQEFRKKKFGSETIASGEFVSDEIDNFSHMDKQLHEIDGSLDHKVKISLKDQEIDEGNHEFEDSIFESVSVAYENRMKSLENEMLESSKIEASIHNEDFEIIDEQLMRELLELSINNRPMSHSTKQNLAASISASRPSSNFQSPTWSHKIGLVKHPHKQISSNSLKLRESQKRLENMLNKFSNKKDVNVDQEIENTLPMSTRNVRKHVKSFQNITNPSVVRKEHSQSKSKVSRTPTATTNRNKEHCKPSFSICSTPKPAFRAGSMMDFSRKIDEEGRRRVAGKNNPYRKLRPKSSHKTSYVDEMLFGQNSLKSSDNTNTWMAPWQSKVKSARPYFCDWVWDRRK